MVAASMAMHAIWRMRKDRGRILVSSWMESGGLAVTRPFYFFSSLGAIEPPNSVSRARDEPASCIRTNLNCAGKELCKRSNEMARFNHLNRFNRSIPFDGLEHHGTLIRPGSAGDRARSMQPFQWSSMVGENIRFNDAGCTIVFE